MENLDKLKKEALQLIEKAKSLPSLKELEVKFLGRKGQLTTLLRDLKNLPENKRKRAGQDLNILKTELENTFSKKEKTLEKTDMEANLSKEFFDTTYPGAERQTGAIHILSQTQKEVEDIFSQMGFMIVDGPEIESEYYNFEGLNIPADHPARDMQDTFFIEGKPDRKQGRLVLRTHTSPNQVRAMEKYGAPLRMIVPGRVFRNEATDARHEHTFHQVEGMLIDKEISIATLKGIMKEFLSRLFGKEVEVRFRPGYFPFVEPGMELDFSCLLCNGKACRVCKKTGWVEFMGAGMTHEHVLRAGGVDPKKYQGWAFGFGLERLVMMRYGINDIRYFQGGDLRFINQFK
ncbi:phenylalanine--tRNA ligase subunit alpha [Candidatus Peregrinibacteria bacterium]|nr:phenylalanine--tRNA ligase subunit alpha [Candidatus Peregrinibacteria bacterium]